MQHGISSKISTVENKIKTSTETAKQ